MTAHELYHAGRLAEAIDAAIADIKKSPTDTGVRAFFCELLCFAGELERADRQLDLLSTQLPESAMQVALFRQLVRADQARHDFFNSGRLPEFIGDPTEAQALCLQASIEIREGNAAAAAELLQAAEEARVAVAGKCGDVEFDDFRDLDDLSCATLEVLTSTGKYFWIAPEKVESIDPLPVESPRDLLWRPVSMSVAGGPDGNVYLPVIYAAAENPEDESLRLGRATDWKGGDSEPTLGQGQRTFLVGNEDRPVLSLDSITFATHGG